jgi:hypothetical protein
MTRDITEGRGDSSGYGRSIAVDLGIVSSNSIWQNTDVAYDTAIGGLPFIYAINDARPYIRETAPFKKDQFDSQQEPGEQSLTGWWVRSQSSFHHGCGIKFYDPGQGGDIVSYRFADSRNVDVWTKGQVSLLRNMTQNHNVTTVNSATTGRARQDLRAIQWVSGGTTYDGVLLHDGWDVDKIDSNGTYVDFVDYNTGTAEPVYAICDDGTYAYWVTNHVGTGANRLHVFKKPLSGDSTTGATLPTLTGDVTLMFSATGTVVTNATMEYVKERIILCVNNSVYEFSTSASSLPTPVYTHPNTSYIYTGITASGPSIYVSGYNGIKSTIQKFSLTSAGALVSLTSAITAAEMPLGEVVHSIHYYLGILMIGTSKGVRAAFVSDQDGSLSYGPLIVETAQPCYQFATRDHYVWCATGVAGEAGAVRIDIGVAIETLRYAWAYDVYVPLATNQTTGIAFIGSTDRIAFCTNKVNSTNGYLYLQDSATLASSGYIKTGNIRFNTLEPKHFERILGRGNFKKGELTIVSVDKNDVEYDHITYSSVIDSIEVTTEPPTSSTEYVAYKFEFYRDATDTTAGPLFKGYQAKAVIAAPRHRVLQFPLFCYDTETDRYNAVTGYEGRAFERILALEHLESDGDVITWQDFSTGEIQSVVIEKVNFTRATPPDKRFSGFGGILTIQLRTV